MNIEINGTTYREIPPQKPSANTIALAAMMVSMTGQGFIQTKAQPKFNIVKEFELIERKESKLSSAQRKYVIRQFNQQYTKV